MYTMSQHVATKRHHTNYTQVSEQFTAANLTNVIPKDILAFCTLFLHILSQVLLLFLRAIIILTLASPRMPFESHIMSNIQLRAHQQMSNSITFIPIKVAQCHIRQKRLRIPRSKNTQTQGLIEWEHGPKGSNSDVKISHFHKGWDAQKNLHPAFFQPLLLQCQLMVKKIFLSPCASQWHCNSPVWPLCQTEVQRLRHHMLFCVIWMTFRVNPQFIYRLGRHIDTACSHEDLVGSRGIPIPIQSSTWAL